MTENDIKFYSKEEKIYVVYGANTFRNPRHRRSKLKKRVALLPKKNIKYMLNSVLSVERSSIEIVHTMSFFFIYFFFLPLRILYTDTQSCMCLSLF